MDLWLVAVATGASYLARYWQKDSKEMEEPFPGISSSDANDEPAPHSFRHHNDGKPYMLNKLPHGKKSHLQPDYAPGNQIVEETALFDNGDTLKYRENNILLQAGYLGFMNQEYKDRLSLDGGFWDRSETSNIGTCAYGTRSISAKSSWRNRQNLQYVKPLSSLESCLIAQLYKQHGEMEGSVVTPPCAPTLRPFVVTNGSRMIYQPSSDSSSAHLTDEREILRRKLHLGSEEYVIGLHPLPMIGPMKGLRNLKLKKENNQVKKCYKSCGGLGSMQLGTQSSPSEAVLCLGICIGITYNSVANKREISKLKELLKQTENLVKDLQEELEMKESVTVKELPNEDHAHESCADNRKLCLATWKSVSDKMMVGNDGASDVDKTTENLGVMCKIEAELEAELERLELNMKGSTLQRRLSEDYEIELHLDSEVDLVEGQLMTDPISRREDSDYSTTSSRGIGAPHPANYAVSPHELCLRLHKVAESRMQQRITELEGELERRQKRMENLESEQQMSVSWRGFFSHSEESSSSAQDSPVTIEAQPVSSPLVMNLSGEALDAYNEGCEELKHAVNRCNVHARDFGDERDRPQEFQAHRSETAEVEMFLQNVFDNTIDNELLGKRTCPDDDEFKSNDSDDTEDDDNMTMLIRQIVNRTRQGSPAVWHAHRAMSSLDRSGR